MSNITVLGLGAMGSRMASALLGGGHTVTVWNRTEGKSVGLLAQGALWAPSPAAAVKHAQFVISMLRDDEASERAWFGNGGALAHMPKSAIAIESSTLSWAWTTALGRQAKAMDIAFLDAPVVGSRPQADAGQLVYLVGGETAVLDQASAILGCMGSAVHHAGPTGSGAVVKLIVNSLFGIQVAALAEALGFAAQAGTPPARLLEILGATPVLSTAAKGAGAGMLSGQFAPMFPLELV
uniref:NAD(P)-dependent oxidoreductase n=1 Tax=Hydrogenophaga sp. TaxID=1904254 RepID=UPI003564E9DF